MSSLFNVASYFVTLRESLEAALVMGIVLAYLRKTGNERHNKPVWFGCAAAVLLSVIIGIIFGVLFYRDGNNPFSGKREKLFEGVTFLIAAALLTWMVIWMFLLGKNLQGDIESGVETALGRGAKGLFFLVFFQIFREGIETVILILGVNSEEDDGGWQAVIIPGLLGIATGILLAVLMFRGLVQLNLALFMNITSVILIFFAAGITSHAFHEIQEVDAFGLWEIGEDDSTVRDWWNNTMWTTKACCNDLDNQFFAMMRALFGYQDTPNFVELSTYFGYWFLIIGAMLYVYRDSVRTARNKIATTYRAVTAFCWVSSFVAMIYSFSNANWISITICVPFFLLSCVAVVGAFDAFVRWRLISGTILKMRRPLNLVVAGGSLLLGVYVFVIALVQMDCTGKEFTPLILPDIERPICTLPVFHHWGLIFDRAWILDVVVNNECVGKRIIETTNFTEIGVLGMSWAFNLFLFAAWPLLAFYFCRNIDETSGEYCYDDVVWNDGENEELLSKASNGVESSQSVSSSGENDDAAEEQVA